MKNKNLRFRLLAILGGVMVLLLTPSTTWAQTGAVNAEQGSKDPGVAAMQYVAGMRVNPATGSINPQDVQEAQNSAAKLIQESAKNDLNWESRGPINKSGRISSFIFDSKDATGSTIYAASPSGGIWKTTNGGLTYNLASNEDNIFKASKLYQAENGDIFACTGEPSDALRFNGYGAFMGDGIYKSTNGSDFTRLEGTNPAGDENSPWACVFNFAIKNNTYYAATIQGLYMSDDNGVSWSITKDNEGEDMTGVCTNVAVTPAGRILTALNSHFYTSEGDNNFTNHSIRYAVTVDSIVNPECLPRDGVSFLNFQYASADENIIYALTCNVDVVQTGDIDEYGTLEGVYATFDGGEVWEEIGPGSSTGFNVFTTSNGPYTAAIAVDPVDPYHIIIGGTNLYDGTFVAHNSFYKWVEVTSSNSPIYYIPANKHQVKYHPTQSNLIYTSTDAGIYSMNLNTFEIKPLFKGLNTTNCYSVNPAHNGSVIASTQSNNSLIIPGYGSLPQNGNSIMNPYYNTSTTGARSYHSFIYPISLIFSNDGVSLIDYYRVDDQEQQHIAFSQNASTNLLVRAKDKSFQVPSVLWESFTNTNSRDSISYTAEEFVPAGTVITVESKNGKYPIHFELPHNLPYGNDSTITIQDPISSKFIVALNGVVYMTLNAVNFFDTPEWYLIADTDNSGFEGISSAVALTKDANHAFVGTEDGKLYRISNLARAYNKERADVTEPNCIVSTDLIYDFEGRYITSIATDPENEDHIVVTLGNYGFDDYVYNCENAAGDVPEFESIQGSLPKAPIYSAVIEMNNSNTVIVGTDLGIYSTDNTSAPNWIYSSANIGTIPVFELKQQTLNHYPIIAGGIKQTVSNYGVIYAATGGRGVFESRSYVGISDYNNNTSQKNTSNITVYPNPVETTAQVSFRSTEPGIGMINVFSMNGQVLKSMTMQVPSAGDNNFTVDMEGFNPGTYILQVVLNGKSNTVKVMVVE